LKIINTILVCIIALMILAPIICIPIVLVYNKVVKIKQNKVNEEPTEKNIKAFIKIINKGPLTKYEKKFESLEKTFKIVYKTKGISFELKSELYDILIKKGCSPEKIKCNNKKR